MKNQIISLTIVLIIASAINLFAQESQEFFLYNANGTTTIYILKSFRISFLSSSDSRTSYNCKGMNLNINESSKPTISVDNTVVLTINGSVYTMPTEPVQPTNSSMREFLLTFPKGSDNMFIYYMTKPGKLEIYITGPALSLSPIKK